MQGNFGVGNISTHLDCIDGLAAHAHAARQVGSPQPTAFADLRQPVFDVRFHLAYFLNWTTSSLVSMRTERAPGLSFGTTSRNRPCAPNSGLPLAVSASRISLSMKEGSSSPSEKTTS